MRLGNPNEWGHLMARYDKDHIAFTSNLFEGYTVGTGTLSSGALFFIPLPAMAERFELGWLSFLGVR
jgi:hypothetical protein